MQTDSYKSRTKNVRSSARSHLIELRKARLARKQAVLSDNAVIESPAPDLQPMQHPAPVNDQPVVTQTHDVGSDGDVLDSMAARNAAMEEVVIPDEMTPIETPQQASAGTDPAHAVNIPDAPIAEPEDCAPDNTPVPTDSAGEAEWQASPLAQLPGAGPGLIWMLNQCEVVTLDDLAALDAVTLSQKLGVVGQILNVDSWIKLAQARTG